MEDEVGRVIDWIVERNLKLWQDISGYIERRQLTRHREGMIGDVGSQLHLQPTGAAGLDRPGFAGGGRELQPGGGVPRHRQRDPGHLRHHRAGPGRRASGWEPWWSRWSPARRPTSPASSWLPRSPSEGSTSSPGSGGRQRRDFQHRIDQLRTHLKEVLTRQVHLELEQSTARINEAIAPYRRFVQSQQQQLNEARGELVATEDALLRLRADIEKR